MYYSENFEISAHDTDPNGLVRPSVILRYLQESANHQMRDQLPSYRDLFERGLSFILSRIQIEKYSELHDYDKITVQTWGADTSRRVRCVRCYRMLRGEEVIAEATGLWAIVDIKTKKLVNVEDVDLSNYSRGEQLPNISTKYFPPKGELAKVGVHTIGYSEIDCNMHMNNTNYPDMLVNYLPEVEKSTVCSMSLSFFSEAPYRECIEILRTEPIDNADGTKTCWFRTLKSDAAVNMEARFIYKTI